MLTPRGVDVEMGHEREVIMILGGLGPGVIDRCELVPLLISAGH